MRTDILAYVVENNGGGLGLFVFNWKELVYTVWGYEQDSGSLMIAIRALISGEEFAREESEDLEEGKKFWAEQVGRGGGTIIAEIGAEDMRIFTSDLGNAGRKELLGGK